MYSNIKWYYKHNSRYKCRIIKSIVYNKKKIFIKFQQILAKTEKRINQLSIFFREFQPMTFAFDDSSLSLDQDTNQFLM